MDAYDLHVFADGNGGAKYIAAMIVAKVNARRTPIAVYLPKSCDAVISFLVFF